MNDARVLNGSALDRLLGTGTLRLLGFDPTLGLAQCFTFRAMRLPHAVRVRASPAPECISGSLASGLVVEARKAMCQGETVTISLPLVRGPAILTYNGEPITDDFDDFRFIHLVCDARPLALEMERALYIMSKIPTDQVAEHLRNERDYIRGLRRLRGPAAATFERHIRTIAVRSSNGHALDPDRQRDFARSIGRNARVLAISVPLEAAVVLRQTAVVYLDWLLEVLVNDLLEEVDPEYFVRAQC